LPVSGLHPRVGVFSQCTMLLYASDFLTVRRSGRIIRGHSFLTALSELQAHMAGDVCLISNKPADRPSSETIPEASRLAQ
ncbi:MAG: hypothetical protein AAF511_06535, partial [Pseudomonadota bacterium]